MKQINLTPFRVVKRQSLHNLNCLNCKNMSAIMPTEKMRAAINNVLTTCLTTETKEDPIDWAISSKLKFVGPIRLR